MKHTVVHGLGREQAKKVTEAAWQSYSSRFSEYSPTVTWTNDYAAKIGFKAKGISINGDIEVNEKDIGIDLDVPFLLKPFKNTAIKVIEEEIQKWIAKSKAGQI
jgi:putative polyhydroxyalkanoic acid system protein